MDRIFAGIIILNYISYEETINCVNDFLKQKKNDEIKIVIVDNYSPNDSFSILSERYKSSSDVFVVQTQKNLGFANGNNYGYKFLIDRYICDYIIVSNDDILIPNDGLFEWIDYNYNMSNFSILGPDVYSVKGDYHQSPCNNAVTNIKKCYYRMIKIKFKIFSLYIRKIFKRKDLEMVIKWENNKYDKLSFDGTLHGSFLVFSKEYFNFYDLPFDERTFMYMEEDILRIRCNNKNLKMVYNPSFIVNHLQAVSTDKIVKSGINKQIYRLKNIYKSYKIYIKVLKNK